MARGSTASGGRAARSESPTRDTPWSNRNSSKVAEASKDFKIVGSDGRIDINSVKNAVVSDDVKNLLNTISADLDKDDKMLKFAGSSAKDLAAGLVTDSVELAYLRSARQSRMDDIAKGGEESPRAVEAQYDQKIADLEDSIKSTMRDFGSIPSTKAKQYAEQVVQMVSASAKSSKGAGDSGEKKVSQYDTKSVRVMVNDIYEELTK
jgi:hypothetical protein